MSLIAANDLTKTYITGEVETRALRGVSLKIESGDFVAIMGPSGCGKSTLMHLLGFLDEPTSGILQYGQKNAAAYTAAERARIRNAEMGFVFQSFYLLAKHTVTQNAILPLLYSSIPEKGWRSRAEEAVAAVELSHRAHHLPSQLSGGEKQRVAIARALITKPKTIFADEPTGNLDSRSGEGVMDILQTLNKNGATVVLVTHDRATAQYAERIIHMKDGQIEREEIL